jgi:hypothetical protein
VTIGDVDGDGHRHEMGPHIIVRIFLSFKSPILFKDHVTFSTCIDFSGA